MMLATLKVAFLNGNGGTVNFILTLDDMVKLDILRRNFEIEKETDRKIFCAEKFSLRNHQRPMENTPRNKIMFCSNRKFLISQESLGFVLTKSPGRVPPGESFALTITGDVRSATNLNIREILPEEPSLLQKWPQDMN